jgi:hypothetical protein
MELRESADGLRWTIGQSWMAVIWVQIAETAGRAVGRTEPDVHLIKQVEQVTMSALGGPTWRLARIPSRGHGRRRNPRISDLVIPGLAVIWLQKQPEEAEGTYTAVPRTGPMGCRAVPLPNSVRLIHHRANLACSPDFKVSHYPLDRASTVLVQHTPARRRPRMDLRVRRSESRSRRCRNPWLRC